MTPIGDDDFHKLVLDELDLWYVEGPEHQFGALMTVLKESGRLIPADADIEETWVVCWCEDGEHRYAKRTSYGNNETWARTALKRHQRGGIGAAPKDHVHLMVRTLIEIPWKHVPIEQPTEGE